MRCFTFHEEVTEGLVVYRDGVQRLACFDDYSPATLTTELEQFIERLPEDPRQLVLLRANVVRNKDRQGLVLGKPIPNEADLTALLHVGTYSGFNGDIRWRGRFSVWPMSERSKAVFEGFAALHLWLLMKPGAQVTIDRTGELHVGEAHHIALRWDGRQMFTERGNIVRTRRTTGWWPHVPTAATGDVRT